MTRLIDDDLFIKGVGYNLTEAEITFDKFHAVKLVNDAVDKVRRAESKDRPEGAQAQSLSLAQKPAASLRRAERKPRYALQDASQDRTRLPAPPRLPGHL